MMNLVCRPSFPIEMEVVPSFPNVLEDEKNLMKIKIGGSARDKSG